MDTILVIEDIEGMRAMLKQTLEAEGYQVITAQDGAEGIKRLADERIGLETTLVAACVAGCGMPVAWLSHWIRTTTKPGGSCAI